VKTFRKRWSAPVAVFLVGAMLLPALAALAEAYDPDEEILPPTGLEKRLTKLGRGLSNVLLGWAEIPVTFDRKLKEGKPLGYLIGVVPVLGGARAVIRTTTGFYEMFTFPVSDLEVNFDPILEPEYIF
jgi:putative exosortase-associated protein (TIGR04073 family)